MNETLFVDTPQTLDFLNALASVLSESRVLTPDLRRRLLAALADCDDDLAANVVRLVKKLNQPGVPSTSRHEILATINDILLPLSSGSQEAMFAERLRAFMESKHVSQTELAERIGCSQPAVSQMLARKRRPRKATILKLADALSVAPRDLWPDLATAEMLDTVADFQDEHYEMTEAEAKALGSASTRNRPKIEPKSLPSRRKT